MSSALRPADNADEDGGVSHLTRWELDKYLIMAERVAIRGLDDTAFSEGEAQHFMPADMPPSSQQPFACAPALQSNQQHALRRVECLAHAHAAALRVAQAELDALQGRESSSPEDLAAAQRKLASIGRFPLRMTGNTREEWDHELAYDAQTLRRMRCLLVCAMRVGLGVDIISDALPEFGLGKNFDSPDVRACRHAEQLVTQCHERGEALGGIVPRPLPVLARLHESPSIVTKDQQTLTHSLARSGQQRQIACALHVNNRCDTPSDTPGAFSH